MPAFLLNSNTGKRTLTLDPRTKLLLLVTMAVFVLGGLGGAKMESFRLVISVMPLFFLLFSRKWRAAVTFALLFSTFYWMQIYLIPMTSGFVNFMVIAMTGIVTRFMPSIAMAYFVMSTTTVSEFVAAMERMRLPEQIVIPMSVIFRFFPTVGEEYTAINDAMRMRGVRFGGGKVTAMLEYRLIPMMICSVKIGEELSASALTRGLGAPVKRTNICRIGFRLPDVIVLALCLLAFGMWIMNSLFV
ncbi:energy-coupling factor transporter transmembrane component T [Faecalispora sporosphaeroides]|uniref:energy-coupling factor transporter transmembrane component T n=1 Tax=Faecalispora sporosphaeroides TaxID=1549 RepID=UPI0003798D54|nr:energy-coupling factor transporter transmembrane component T [Faecalispora sporosphaeroides]